MKNFKLWMEENETPHFTYPDNIYPRDMIGQGYFARVYSTNHPNVVMRVEPIDPQKKLLPPRFFGQPCEKFMMKPEIQATKGVAKIYNNQIREFDLNEDRNPIFITYKEKLNTNFEDYFMHKYGPEKTNYLLSTINRYQTNQDKLIKRLEKFSPETDNLIKAIQLGLPFHDLHQDNLALDKENNLVVIDC